MQSLCYNKILNWVIYFRKKIHKTHFTLILANKFQPSPKVFTFKVITFSYSRQAPVVESATKMQRLNPIILKYITGLRLT